MPLHAFMTCTGTFSPLPAASFAKIFRMTYVGGLFLLLHHAAVVRLILNGGSSRIGEGRKWSRLIMRYCPF